MGVPGGSVEVPWGRILAGVVLGFVAGWISTQLYLLHAEWRQPGIRQSEPLLALAAVPILGAALTTGLLASLTAPRTEHAPWRRAAETIAYSALGLLVGLHSVHSPRTSTVLLLLATSLASASLVYLGRSWLLGRTHRDTPTEGDSAGRNT